MLAALGRSGDGRARPRMWSGVLVVAVLVAGAIAPAAAALTDDDWPSRVRSVLTALAAPHAPVARPVDGPVSPRPHVELASGADLHGVLRSTKLTITGADVHTGAVVAVALAVTGTPVAAVVANGLSLVAAGTGPLVSARHLSGHLRT